MASHIERRKFLATLSGVAGWPLVARGQQEYSVMRSEEGGRLNRVYSGAAPR